MLHLDELGDDPAINETDAVTPDPAINETAGQVFVEQLVPALPPWQSFLFILAVSLVLAAIIQVVGSRIVKHLLSRFDQFDDIVFREIHTPIYMTVALGGFYLAFLSLQLDQIINFYFRAIIGTVIILIWGRAAKRVGYQILAHFEETERKKEFIPIFENIWLFVVVFATVFVLMTVWRIDITPLLASAGIAGVVAGFAAQDTVRNLFGGFALYLDDTYRIGDMIQFDSDERGTPFERAMVTDLGIRSTTVVTRDEVQITIPNSVLNSTKVINESAPKKRKRLRIPISVAYGSDLDHFEEVMLEIADEDERVLDHPNPRLRFREFGDSSLDYELLCWVENPVLEGRTVHHLNRAIHKRLDEEGIEIPFPQRDVHQYKGEPKPHKKENLDPEEVINEEYLGEKENEFPSGGDDTGDDPSEDTADDDDGSSSDDDTDDPSKNS